MHARYLPITASKAQSLFHFIIVDEQVRKPFFVAVNGRADFENVPKPTRQHLHARIVVEIELDDRSVHDRDANIRVP